MFILFSVLLSGMVSSFEFDNFIDYSNEDKTVTFTNAFGLGETIAKAELTSHSNVNQPLYVMPGSNRLVLSYDIENYGDNYKNAIQGFDIVNMKDSKTVAKQFKYKYAVYETVQVNDYIEVCEQYVDKQYGPGKRCHSEIVGTHSERRVKEWKQIISTDIPKGNITIGIFTDVSKGDYYDGVITLFGDKLSRHAYWTASLEVGLISWFKMDTGSGGDIIDSFGFRNGSTQDVLFTTDGLINNATNHTSATSGINLTDGISNLPSYTFGNGSDFTWSVWVNATYYGRSSENIINKGDSYAMGMMEGNLSTWTWVGGFTTNIGSPIENSTWNHLAFVVDGTSGKGQRFINGAPDGAEYDWKGDKDGVKKTVIGATYDSKFRVWGAIDELGMWNRSLSSGEINQLWNDGVGISLYVEAPPPVGTITATQSYPIDTFNTTDRTINMGCNFSTNDGENITARSLFIFNSTHKIVFSNVTSGLLLKDLNETFITTALPIGTYNWSCTANGSIANSTTTNRTLTIARFFDVLQVYNETSYDSSTENFKINITFNENVYSLVSGFLRYNGTRYTSTGSTDGASATFNKNILVSEVSSDANISYIWEFSFTNATGTDWENSSWGNQTALPINASIYGFPYNDTFINFTVYDEGTEKLLNATFDIVLSYGFSSPFKNLTYQDSTEKNSTFPFSFNPASESYIISGVIEYDATGYESRLYSIPEQNVTSAGQIVKLYLLNVSDSTTFVIKVQDSTFSPVVGGVVHIQRFYTSSNEWVTMEIVTTNDVGKALGHFATEDVNYRFLVYVDSVLKLTSTPTKIFCEIAPCTITLTFPGEEGIAKFEDPSGLAFSLTYSKATEIFTYSYTDSATGALGGRLRVIRNNYRNATQTTICNEISTAASAVLTCDISLEINGTYIGYAYNNREGGEGSLLDILTINKARNIVLNVGLDGLIWAVFLIMGIVMLGLFKPALAIVFSIGALFFIGLLGLVSIPAVAFFSLLFIGIFLLWEMRK